MFCIPVYLSNNKLIIYTYYQSNDVFYYCNLTDITLTILSSLILPASWSLTPPYLGIRSTLNTDFNYTYDMPYKINNNWLYMNRLENRILIRITDNDMLFAYKIKNRYP